MILQDSVTWNFKIHKVITKDTGLLSNAIVNVKGNLHGFYNGTKGSADFNVDIPITADDNFVQYEDLTTDHVITFIENSISESDLILLKDKALVEINALNGQEYYKTVERDWV